MILNLNPQERLLAIKILHDAGYGYTIEVPEEGAWQPPDEVAMDFTNQLEKELAVYKSLMEKVEAQTIRGTLNLDLFGASI